MEQAGGNAGQQLAQVRRGAGRKMGGRGRRGKGWEGRGKQQGEEEGWKVCGKSWQRWQGTGAGENEVWGAMGGGGKGGGGAWGWKVEVKGLRGGMEYKLGAMLADNSRR